MDRKEKGPIGRKGDVRPNVLSTLASEMDQLVAEYIADPGVIFASDGERNRSYFEHRRRARRDWVSSKKCFFPDCAANSVRRSHTIPRAALRLIADEGHVATPDFDTKVGGTTVQRLGTVVASTFPGFCATHEQIFGSFERTRRLGEQTHHLLQMFRTVTRELAAKAHHLKWIEILVESTRARIDAWGQRRLASLVPSRKVGEVRIEKGGVHVGAERFLSQAKAELDIFRQEFFDPFLVAGDSSEDLPFSLRHHKLPVTLPVALAGRGNFLYRTEKDGSTHEVRILVNIIPEDDGSALFVVAPSKHATALDLYLSKNLGGGDDLEATTRTIESWMLSATDHWFIAPRVWEVLGPRDQEAVLEALGKTDNNLGNPSRVPALSSALLSLAIRCR